MAKENETIADIIAEKRRRADDIERDCTEKMKRGEMTSDQYARKLVADMRREADRFDAAYKRERGDFAKLREACEAALDMIFDLQNCHRSPIANSVYAVRRIIKDALAAPPRNCDVYNNESCRMAYHLHGDGLMTMQAFADWLFAPATEKEGGAK